MKGIISLSRAAELIGITVLKFKEILTSRGIVRETEGKKISEMDKQIILFYNSLKSTPKMIDHLLRKRRSSPYPSEVDIALLVYSRSISAPILTNDSDMTAFKSELINNNFCFDIFSLQEEIPDIK